MRHINIASFNQPLLRFYPSINEIEESELSNPYMGGLDEFYKSINELLESFKKEFFKLRSQENGTIPTVKMYKGVFTERGEQINRNAPPEIAELIVYLGTSGIAIAFYELLKLWIQKKNGRRIKVKIRDIEVEVTQMNTKEFKKFFEMMMEYSSKDKFQKKESNSEFLKSLKENDITYTLFEDSIYSKEEKEIKLKVMDSMKKALEKLEKEDKDKSL